MLRVAFRCGLPSVRHFEERFGDLTWRELLEVAELERLDPPIGRRLDVLFAVLCSVVANSRMAGKGAKTFKPEEFLPAWARKPKKPQSPEEMLSSFKAAIGR